MSAVEAGKPKEIQKTRLLIGEGKEEVILFSALLAHLGISSVQVEYYEGKSNLGDYLRAMRSRPGFAAIEKLGITRDADEDPAAAASSVEYAIGQAEFPSSLSVAKLILPGGARVGALENLCLETIAGQPIGRCIEEYLTCAATATGISHSTLTNKAKARIHAWLAAQPQPDLRLGLAAQQKLLNWDSPAFDELKAFIRGLA